MQIPLLALLIITIILQFVGFLWYGKLFGKTWARISGLLPANQMTPEDNRAFRKKMGPVYFLNFLLSLLTVATLWLFARFMGGSLVLAFIFWLGFVMPTLATVAMFSGKPRKIAVQMFAVTAGYQLISFLVAGFFLALWA